ncbi:MAG: histidinol-phosphatase [Deltaproteobacteria bacterium]|jgi:histidinol-phosphatase (PHP family)|nr:histidinol-phosphatase [Deltaproteobacteria bacterium]
MILADLHTHTNFSHGADSAPVMQAAAKNKGLAIYGFSEHSPRPRGYSYPSDYQEKLEAGFSRYISETAALRRASTPDFATLLGLEADFIPAEISFSREITESADFDYIIGGLHFQGNWGFDAKAEDWEKLSLKERFACYARYYEDLARLCASGLADIIAHPDLIKIFTPESFNLWLEKPSSLNLVRAALTEAKSGKVLLELSSAGLRKPCREVYPGPKIMEIAADLGLGLSIASDAHAAGQIAHAFAELESYARGFGFTGYAVVKKRQTRNFEF